MQAVKLKVNITKDHRVDGVVPDDVPQGEAEVVVLYSIQADEEESGIAQLLSFFECVQKKKYPRRNMDEILEYINKERDSWED